MGDQPWGRFSSSKLRAAQFPCFARGFQGGEGEDREGDCGARPAAQHDGGGAGSVGPSQPQGEELGMSTDKGPDDPFGAPPPPVSGQVSTRLSS